MAKNWSDWSRRTVLKSIGIGATVPLFGGVAAADNCPGCPEGTRLLAKYNFDDEDDVFRFETGACEDPFTEIDYTNKEGEDGEPIEVSFTSPVLAHDVVVKRGPDCDFASDDDDITFAVDDEKDDDGFEHTISVPEDSRAISHFSVCAGVCFQVDFVTGEVIEELGEDGLYTSERLIAARWDGTAVEGGDVVNNSPFTDDGDGDTITTADGVTLNAEETEGSVKFDVTLNSDDVTLTLASYVATCPASFDEDTAHLQDLVDHKTVTCDSDVDDVTLTVDLPGTEWLDELCVN